MSTVLLLQVQRSKIEKVADFQFRPSVKYFNTQINGKSKKISEVIRENGTKKLSSV